MITINVITALFLIASAVSVVIAMRSIDRNIKDEKRKILLFVALIIFQVSLVAFFAANF